MNKEEALKLIDDHKNKLIDPVEMLRWTWLRVIVMNMGEICWDHAEGKAAEVLSR